MSLLAAAGLGLGLGVVTGMPLGVINVAVVDAAVAGRRWFATGLGLGGGGADAVHAMLAFVGVGRLVTVEPALVRGLAIGAAIAIVVYAALAWRRRADLSDRPRMDAGAPPRDPPSPTRAELAVLRGAATGFVLTLPNPGALAAWVAVAAALWPDAALHEAAVLAGGVGIGSALWFGLLARWVAGLRRDHPVLAAVPRVALLLLIAIAIVGVVRAL